MAYTPEALEAVREATSKEVETHELNNFPSKLNHGVSFDAVEQGESPDHFNPRYIWQELGYEDVPFWQIYESLEGDPEGFSDKYLNQTPGEFYAEIDAVQEKVGIQPIVLRVIRERIDRSVRGIADDYKNTTYAEREASNRLYALYVDVANHVYSRLLTLGYNEEDLQRG